MFVVTRQLQWPEGKKVVELSYGSIDYVNPDALSPMFEGEMEEINDPRDAAKIAISVYNKWKKNEPNSKIYIGIGDTGGYTAPFEALNNIKDIEKIAEDIYKKMPKCAKCRELLPDKNKRWHLTISNEEFCSQQCADDAYYFLTGKIV